MNKNFKEFTNEVKELLLQRLGDAYEITVKEVKKNNGQVYQGVLIKQKECNIAPTFYIDQSYKEYESHMKSCDEIAEEILDSFQKHRISQDYQVDEILDFEKSKDKICFELINYEQNAELLETIPYIPYHDLAIVFRVLCSIEQQEASGTILITNELKKHWNHISEKELYQIALQNTPRLLECKIQKMSDLIKELYTGMDENTSEDIFEDAIPIYVLTNKNNYKGAAALICPDVLEEFAKEHQTDFYILPSSIHEVLLIPAEYEDSAEALKNMVVQINESEVAVEDRLSNHIYYYTLKTQSVSIVA